MKSSPKLRPNGWDALAAAAALAVDTAAVGDYAVPRLLERYLLEYDG